MTGFLTPPGPRAFAHRGWHTGDLAGLENSMAAFRRAVDEGYRYLETDVHLTRDRKLVAFHDDRLDRVTDSVGLIANLTWDEVRQARIGGREPIPLMEQVLAEFPGAYFNIDPKADASVGPLIDLIRSAGAVDRVCIGSFSDARLAAVRAALGPGLATSIGPRGIGSLVLAARLGRPGRAPGAVAAQVPTRFGRVQVVNPRFVDTAHGAGLEVHVWTIDDPAVMYRLLDLGVDGIMTDRPELLRQVLTDRGLWR